MALVLPHIRFWQGFANPALTDRDFTTALQQVLIPMTTEVGVGKGLTAYLPVVLQREPQGECLPPLPNLPDEMALVVYENQDRYNEIRATVFDIFNQIRQFFVAGFQMTQLLPLSIAESHRREFPLERHGEASGYNLQFEF